MENAIEQILTRGVEEIIDRQDFEAKLRSGKKLRLKIGIDPTSKNIHIGRAMTLWKLRQLQELGHKVIFIVGDFTGLIGDTSDKDAERPMLSKKEVQENMKSYATQAGKILDMRKTEVQYNSKWLKKLGFFEIAEQADQFSLHEFVARELIAKRMKEGKRVSLRELLYPLMQGYDSVAIKADFEMGGTDQRFNLLAGRTLQKFYGQQPQNIMTLKLLSGTDGRKMSSSWGNVINITDAPNDMFGKTMSILDGLIVEYMTFCTQIDLEEIKKISSELASGKMNPRDAKARLAKELVCIYHGEKTAEQAEQHFNSVHRDKEMPEKIEEFALAGSTIVQALTGAGLAKSSGEAKRLIDQGGVKIDSKIVSEYNDYVASGMIIQVGKRNFIKVK